MKKLLTALVAAGIVCPAIGQDTATAVQEPAETETQAVPAQHDTAATVAQPADTMEQEPEAAEPSPEEAEESETSEAPSAETDDETAETAQEPEEAVEQLAEEVEELAQAVEPEDVVEEPAEKKVSFVLKPYGFVKGDMYLTNNHEASSYDTDALTCVNRAVPDGGGGIQFTAQHSRFGLKGNVDVKEIEIGARVELDFWVIAANANANPRLRLAYGWLKPVTGLTVLVGQQWDLFSPLNPTTNNTNANLWFNGNYGFRRPQFTVEYVAPFEIVKPGIQVSVGEATKEASFAADLGADNLSGHPMIQSRIYAGLPLGITVGFSGVYAPYLRSRAIETFGFSADATLPFHDLISLKGEFAYGSNLHNGNIFTIGGSGTVGDPVNTNGGWFNVITKPLSWLTVVGGYGVENVRTTTAPGTPKANLTFYGDAIFTIGKYFSFAVEGQRIITSYGGDDATVNVLDVSGKVSF